jgi:peroxiredoxin
MSTYSASLALVSMVFIDPLGRIARVFTDVKPAVHSREVLAALNGLGASGK